MKDKFPISRRGNFRTTLHSISAEDGEKSALAQEPSWVVENIVPGHSILLHHESPEDSVERLEQIRNENSKILFQEILSQRKMGEENLSIFGPKIEELNAKFEQIKGRFAENLRDLERTDAAILSTLYQNNTKELEQLSLVLDNALKEVNDIIARSQAAINQCWALSPDSLGKEPQKESTLSDKLQPINEAGKNLKDLIENTGQFMESFSHEQVTENIPVQMDAGIPLYQAKDMAEYVKAVILALNNVENSVLLAGMINYRAERLAAISCLIEQLALSLALNEPKEKIDLLYHWIEICRGKSPANRLLKPDRLHEKALDWIHHNPALNEIYFALPRVLRADLSPESERRAEKIHVIDSMRSIDDPNLTSDDVLMRWSQFISQEKILLMSMENFKDYPRSFLLMEELNIAAAEQINVDNAIQEKWNKQLKAAYKLYQIEQGISPEKRLLTQEPLTQEEYTLIKTHLSFLPVYRGLNASTQEALRREQYRSILLDVLAQSEGTPFNRDGLIEHNLQDPMTTTEVLLEGGRAEFVRGFKMLVSGEFLNYKIRHESPLELRGLLMENGFTLEEANSIIGFARNQNFYYILFYYLSSCALSTKDDVYGANQSPTYVNIYKSDGEIYFEVKSGPWALVRTSDAKSFPSQPENDQDENRPAENFYAAEFKLHYKLMPGKEIKYDVLRLLEVTTDRPASWQLLSFDNSEFNKLSVIKIHFKEIDSVMGDLGDLNYSNLHARQAAKKKIEEWLSDEHNTFHFTDYEYIQTHLRSISRADLLSHTIGKDWLEFNLQRCALKIETHRELQQEVEEQEKAEVLLSEQSILTPVDVQAIGCDLVSNIAERVQPAQRRIEAFLDSENPSVKKCEELKIFLKQLLKVAQGEILNEDNMHYMDWLQTQIKLCELHIAAANDAAFEKINIIEVVYQLMVPDRRENAKKIINDFLDSPMRDGGKLKALADSLLRCKINLLAQGGEDPHFREWLNASIASAMNISAEREESIQSSIAEYTANLEREEEMPSSIRKDEKAEKAERQDRFFSSSSSSSSVSLSQAPSALPVEPQQNRTPSFFRSQNENGRGIRTSLRALRDSVLGIGKSQPH